MYQLLNEAKLTREPKQRYEYSNWGFGLLAEALVRAAKADHYQMLLEREVLSKLGMSETTLRPRSEGEARVAQGYARDGFPAPRNLSTWPAFNGGGALYSTIGDMVKYLSFNLRLRQTTLDSALSIVQRPTARGLTSGHNVGLGWEIRDDPKLNLTIIGKQGGTRCFTSYIGLIRGEPTGVVVLANSVVTNSTEIGRQILSLLAEKPEPPTPSIATHAARPPQAGKEQVCIRGVSDRLPHFIFAAHLGIVLTYFFTRLGPDDKLIGNPGAAVCGSNQLCSGFKVQGSTGC
jgi:D-alanyl-D-alanine-carboxypeptidase/D-alanyl-D-alanine-endopeptidase